MATNSASVELSPILFLCWSLASRLVRLLVVSHIIPFWVLHISLDSCFYSAICIYKIVLVWASWLFLMWFLPIAHVCLCPWLHAGIYQDIVTTMYLLPFINCIWHYHASRDTVGELVSTLVVHSLCDLLSVQTTALMVPSDFLFRNMRYLSAFFHSSYDMSSFSFGSSAFSSCTWSRHHILYCRISLSFFYENLHHRYMSMCFGNTGSGWWMSGLCHIIIHIYFCRYGSLLCDLW